MKFKPKDIAIIAAMIVGVAIALYVIFGPLSQEAEVKPSPSPSDQILTPIPQVTTEAPKPVAPVPTATPTPTSTEALSSDWTKGSGSGMEYTDPDSLAAKAVATEFLPIYQNRYGYQYANSLSYLDDLKSKGLITQNFYDNKNTGAAVPSKSAAKKIEMVTTDIDCPMQSQAGPLLQGDKGSFRCFYKSGYEIDGTDVQRDEMDEVGLPWNEPTEVYSYMFQVVKDGDTWKIDGLI